MENLITLLDAEQKAKVKELALSGSTPALRRRAIILLFYDEGLPTRQVAQEVGMSAGRVRYWRRQFQVRGMEIFNPRRRRSALQSPTTRQMQTVEGETLLENTPPILPTPEAESAGITSPAQKTGLTESERSTDSPEPGSARPPKNKRKKKAGNKVEESLEARPLTSTEDIQGLKQEAMQEELESADFEGYLDESKGKDLPYPQPLPEPGLLSGDTLAEAGRKTLLYHFAVMLEHEEGTRLGDDIEELHDMRVATRRMRAAFDLFEQAFDPKVIRRHLRGLKATGRALGAVRDMDVFIEKANHYMDALSPEQRQGLEVLVEAWQEQRESAREAMLVHLNSPDYAAFKRKFNNFVQTPGKGVRLLSTECPVPPMARDAAPVLIYSRFGAVRAYDQLLESATLEQLHALRIEFKKLRYAVEFFREILGKEAKSVINVLKTMQDHLGDLNDAQVATQLLSDFLGRMEFSHLDLPLSERRNPEPVVMYLAAKHAERHQLMRTFPAAWEAFNQPEFRQNLALAVASL
jgi:CHAD domain-containing protein/transposase-like protein